MTEPTVQVPVSLIKDADRYIEGLGLKPTSAQANWARAGYLAGRAHSLSQPTPTAEPSVPATELPQLRYSADLHAGRLRARVRELPDSYRRDAALMTEAADQLEYLSRAELDNHHAADMCPYCTPDPTQRRRDQVDVDALVHELFPERQPTAEPPRIEDMAPGTIFTGKFIPGGERRTFQRTTGSWPVRTLGSRIGYRVEDIVPSTIRDVTPPKEEGRG